MQPSHYGKRFSKKGSSFLEQLLLHPFRPLEIIIRLHNLFIHQKGHGGPYHYIVYCNTVLGLSRKLTHYNIGWLSSKLLHDPLEAGVFSDFCGGVNILNREQGAQAEQEDLGQSGYKLTNGNNKTLSRSLRAEPTWVWVTITLTQSDLASISWRHLLARASQPSVWLSISPRRVIQSSRLFAPSRPPTLFPDKENPWLIRKQLQYQDLLYVLKVSLIFLNLKASFLIQSTPPLIPPVAR